MPMLSQYDDYQAARRLRVQVGALRRAAAGGVVPRPDIGFCWSRALVEAMDREAIRVFEEAPKRRTEYGEGELAGRLRVPVAAVRWGRHTGTVPAPDTEGGLWSRAAVEAMDPEAIRAGLTGEPLSAYEAAELLAAALGTPTAPEERPVVRPFAVRQLVAEGLLVDLSGNPTTTLVHPDQVAAIAARPGLAELLAPLAPLGPDQAAERLGVRRSDWDHMVRLGWVKPAEWAEVRFGTSRAGAVDVPIYRAGVVDSIPAAHPEVDWPALRSVGKGRRSPLAALSPAAG
ncbi:hypothetical protein [Streptomyces tsukubensis]|uniref:hypothetical protein n=1 Tax=Streptomyces tsukubensis TaxID=83656 RepID=UPI00344B0439